MRKIAVSLGVLMSLVGSMTAFAGTTVPKKVQIADAAGDANYANDQVVSTFAPAEAGDVAAASAIPQADILKVWYTHDAKTVTVHIQTAAPLPGPIPLFFMAKSNPGDANGTVNGCTSLYAAVETEVVDAAVADCATGTREGKASFSELPDGTGVLEITGDRVASVSFMPGASITAPRAYSMNTTQRSMGMPSLNLPVIDNTKAGADYKLR